MNLAVGFSFVDRVFKYMMRNIEKPPTLVTGIFPQSVPVP
jgi:hypothetical protein